MPLITKTFKTCFLAVISVLASMSIDAKQIVNGEEEIQFTNGDQSVVAFEGRLEVPENRNSRHSRNIPLTYVRFPATGNKSGPPIIYLSGGPGGSGISTAKQRGFRFPLFMALREFGDVIALDQRGTGKSRVVPKCESSQQLPLTDVLEESQIVKKYRLAAKECVAFWKENGADVLGYTSIQSAHDINALRQHLNADKVILWGISYGTHLAFASLKVMPNHIDKLVLASAEGLNQTVKLPAETDAYFERLQRAINQQPKAKAAYPDIKRLMRRVHANLAAKPILIKLEQQEGDSIDFLFQTSHLQGLTSALIADPHRFIPMLLQLYTQLDNGVTVMLPDLVKRVGFANSAISFNIMSFGMDVASGITEDRLKLVNQQSTKSLLGKFLNFPMPQLNRVIPALDLGDEYRHYPQSNVPTLLLTGTLDGRTYIQPQRDATQGLTNVTQVMINNAGHNLFMVSPEVTEVIRTFLSNKPIVTKTIDVKLPPFVR